MIGTMRATFFFLFLVYLYFSVMSNSMKVNKSYEILRNWIRVNCNQWLIFLEWEKKLKQNFNKKWLSLHFRNINIIFIWNQQQIHWDCRGSTKREKAKKFIKNISKYSLKLFACKVKKFVGLHFMEIIVVWCLIKHRCRYCFFPTANSFYRNFYISARVETVECVFTLKRNAHAVSSFHLIWSDFMLQWLFPKSISIFHSILRIVVVFESVFISQVSMLRLNFTYCIITQSRYSIHFGFCAFL